jgi:cbb3-type cytochrome oxidase subunit 3
MKERCRMAAQEVKIQGTDAMAKIRTPWVVAVLTLVTFGIYGLVWYYKVNREMADLGRATGHSEELGTSPGTSLLAITLGALIIVPAIISIVHTHQRIVAAQRITGGGEPINGWLVLIMFLVGLSIVAYAYWQSGLDKAWEAQAGGMPAPEASPVPAS